jgi:general secretion pathway protein A
MAWRLGLLACVMLAAAGVGSPAVGEAPPQADIELARLLALLLDSGRVVLAERQPMLNDPSRGDKGFTAAVFEGEVVEEFLQRSGGLDLARLETTKISDQGKQLLWSLMVVGKEVIEEKQPVINEKYLGYKNLIPATWGTWTTKKFSQRTRARLKQTALDYRNPNNAPDEFETRILRKFADPSYPREGERVFTEVAGGGKSLRLMLPLFHKKECLVCHGTAKGDIDISGYRKEGHKEGDSAGAISVTIPLQGN